MLLAIVVLGLLGGSLAAKDGVFQQPIKKHAQAELKFETDASLRAAQGHNELALKAIKRYHRLKDMQ